MKQFLILFLSILTISSFAQENSDSLHIEKESNVSKYRIRADIGVSRKFGDWTSAEFPTYNYLLKDLKYSGVNTFGFDYLIKDKVENRVYLGLTYSGVRGMKTMPNQEFTDSLGATYVSNYSFKNSYQTLAIQLSGTRYIGEGETLALWSAIQLGKSWFTSEELAVNAKESKGSSNSAGVMLGLDFKLSDHVFLGGEIRGWYSKVGELEITKKNLETEEVLVETVTLNDLEQINLSRVDFTIGVRYCF